MWPCNCIQAWVLGQIYENLRIEFEEEFGLICLVHNYGIENVN